MATETETIRLVMDQGKFLVDIQKSKDKIKELDKAIKELKEGSGARKDLVILKGQEQQKLKDLQKELKNTEKAIKNTGETSKIAFSSIAAGITLAIATMGKLLNMANKEEDSQRKVNFLFKEQGKNVIALASELQKLTGVNNQTIQDMAVMAKTMGVSNGNIQNVIQGAIGLEKALGIDATSAVRYLSLAIEEGDYSMLNRYIPTLRTLETDTEKQAELNRILGDSFELAKDRMNTTAGAFETLSNTITDESENIGFELQKSLGMGNDSALNVVISGISKFLQWMVQGLRALGTNLGIYANNTVEVFAGVGKAVISVFAGIIKTVNGTFQGLGKDLYHLVHGEFSEVGKGIKDGLTSGIDDALEKIKLDFQNIELAEFNVEILKFQKATEGASEKLKDEAKATDELTASFESLNAEIRKVAYDSVPSIKLLDDTLRKLLDTGEVDLPKFTASFQDLVYAAVSGGQYAAEELTKLVEAYNQTAQTVLNVGSQMTQYELTEIESRYSTQEDMYKQMLDRNQISYEEYQEKIEKLKNKEDKEKRDILKSQKKYDISSAISNIAVGVTKAFELPLPLNWIQAAAITTAGAIQVATIAKQKFADGGVLVGKSHAQGGIIAGNVELEGDEGVINKRSMSNPYLRQAASLINQAGGGVAFPGVGSLPSISSSNTSNTQMLSKLDAINANLANLELQVNINQKIESDIAKVTQNVTKGQRAMERNGEILEYK